MDIIAISLTTALERRRHFHEQAERLGLVYEFFDAIVPAQADDAFRARYNRRRAAGFGFSPMSPVEMAVWASHLAVHRRILDEGRDGAVVLEDDVLFQDGFREAIAALPAARTAWDLVYLYDQARESVRIEPVGPTWLVLPRRNMYGAYAYAVSRRGAERFAAYAQRFFAPIDFQLGRVYEYGAHGFALSPAVIAHDFGLPSAVQEGRNFKHRHDRGFTRRKRRFFRARFKLVTSLKRQFHVFRERWRLRKQR